MTVSVEKYATISCAFFMSGMDICVSYLFVSVCIVVKDIVECVAVFHSNLLFIRLYIKLYC